MDLCEEGEEVSFYSSPVLLSFSFTVIANTLAVWREHPFIFSPDETSREESQSFEEQ